MLVVSIKGIEYQSSKLTSPGTNTDCVLLDPTKQHTESRGIIACAKSLTTPDITTGIFTVMKKVIEASQVKTDKIAIVTIGTTVSLITYKLTSKHN